MFFVVYFFSIFFVCLLFFAFSHFFCFSFSLFLGVSIFGCLFLYHFRVGISIWICVLCCFILHSPHILQTPFIFFYILLYSLFNIVWVKCISFYSSPSQTSTRVLFTLQLQDLVAYGNGHLSTSEVFFSIYSIYSMIGSCWVWWDIGWLMIVVVVIWSFLSSWLRVNAFFMSNCHISILSLFSMLWSSYCNGIGESIVFIL